ncbi:hypothetical protein Bca4012_048509 [Brassica carinata]
MDEASFYVGGSIIWDGGSLDGFSLSRSLCFAAVTGRRYMWCLLDLGGRVSFSRITALGFRANLNLSVQAFGAAGRLYGWCSDGQVKEHAWFLDTSAS